MKDVEFKWHDKRLQQCQPEDGGSGFIQNITECLPNHCILYRKAIVCVYPWFSQEHMKKWDVLEDRGICSR